MAALLSLGCQRCVLLTGTPLQNNLDEFYGMHHASLLQGNATV